MKLHKLSVIYLCLLPILFSCKQKDESTINVFKAQEIPKIDGLANDACWKKGDWYPLNQIWLGDAYSPDDFMGHYKLSWSEEALYILVEITDDILLDQHSDPLKLWWDDDCVEVFIDEDNSGGEHQYNHNAFAYHVALDGNVVDLGPDKKPHLYNDHVISKRITTGNSTIWEMAVKLYDDSFIDGGTNTPRPLVLGEDIGFALAYCDNDTSQERENFIGSVVVKGDDKNRGWIDAYIFGNIILKE